MQQSTTENLPLFSYHWQKQRCNCSSIPELSAYSSPKQAKPGLGEKLQWSAVYLHTSYLWHLIQSKAHSVCRVPADFYWQQKPNRKSRISFNKWTVIICSLKFAILLCKASFYHSGFKYGLHFPLFLCKKWMLKKKKLLKRKQSHETGQ